MPEFKPRFGLIPAPIENASEAVGGELMVNRNNGHIYVRKDGENVSKTVENEERLNDVDERTKVISQHVVLGNSNWTRLCKTNNGDINIHFNSTIGCMEFSNIISTALVVIDNYISIDRLREYSMAFSINNFGGESNTSFGLILFDANFNKLETVYCYNDISKKINVSKNFGNFLNSSYNISEKACYGKLVLEFSNRSATKSPAFVSIDFLEISSIPSYYLDGLNNFKNSYVHINSLSDISPKELETDKGVETGENIKIINTVSHQFKVRYGRYSVCVRMKINSIPTITAIGSLRITKTENGVETDIRHTSIPTDIYKNSNEYKTFYTAFEFSGADYKNTKLTLYFHNTSGIKCSLDYITIMPSVVGSFQI